MTYQAKVIAGGKMVIPADLRRELNIQDGDLLVIDRDENGHLVLKTYEQVVREVQATFRRLRTPGDGTSMVDELLADRREEAQREDAALDRWLAEADVVERE